MRAKAERRQSGNLNFKDKLADKATTVIGGIVFASGRSLIWKLLLGAASDVAVGGDGSVWVVGTPSASGGHGIYHWTGTGWTAVPGGAVSIAVGPDGMPWVTNSTNQIYVG
jgi:hypothetical protein